MGSGTAIPRIKMGDHKYKRIDEIVAALRKKLGNMSEKEIEAFADMFGLGDKNEMLFVHEGLID